MATVFHSLMVTFIASVTWRRRRVFWCIARAKRGFRTDWLPHPFDSERDHPEELVPIAVTLALCAAIFAIWSDPKSSRAMERVTRI